MYVRVCVHTWCYNMRSLCLCLFGQALTSTQQRHGCERRGCLISEGKPSALHSHNGQVCATSHKRRCSGRLWRSRDARQRCGLLCHSTFTFRVYTLCGGLLLHAKYGSILPRTIKDCLIADDPLDTLRGMSPCI